MAEIELVIPGITDPNTLVCIARSRNYKQYCLMVEDALVGRCPFCKLDPKTNRVLIRGYSGWQAWQNPSPEKHTRHHFTIAPERHVLDTDDLTDDEWLGLHDIQRSLKEKYGYTSRGILIRDGDATLSAGTIQHLHVHVMVPDGTGRVESPFYKGVEDEAAGVARAIVYEKMRQGIPYVCLPLEEAELVRDRMK